MNEHAYGFSSGRTLRLMGACIWCACHLCKHSTHPPQHLGSFQSADDCLPSWPRHITSSIFCIGTLSTLYLGLRRMLHAGEGDVRLIDVGEIDNWTIGRLQVYFEGSWSQVCSTNFDAPDADVACRQLGYGPGAIAMQALATQDLDSLRRKKTFFRKSL